MRNLLALVGAAVVTFCVLGYSLGWFTIQSTPGSDGHRQVNIDVNTPKIVHDIKEGEEAAQNYLKKNGTAAQTAPPNGTPAPSGPGAVVVRPNSQPDPEPNGN